MIVTSIFLPHEQVFTSVPSIDFVIHLAQSFFPVSRKINGLRVLPLLVSEGIMFGDSMEDADSLSFRTGPLNVVPFLNPRELGGDILVDIGLVCVYNDMLTVCLQFICISKVCEIGPDNTLPSLVALDLFPLDSTPLILE